MATPAFTEEDWLAGRNANAMLEQVRDLAGGHRERKWTLFACGACRHLGPLLTPWGEKIVTAFEREADGGPVVERTFETFGTPPDGIDRRIEPLLGRVRERSIARVLWLTGLSLGHANMDFTPFAPLLHCLFGNPFRPVIGTPSAAIRALAERCYSAFPNIDKADFSVLADALEEANQLAAAAHLRSGAHFRGCHAIDWARGLLQ